MVLIIHDNDKVLKLINKSGQSIVDKLILRKPITETVLELAKILPDTLLLWCQKTYEPFLNLEVLPSVFHHKRILASFHPHEENYLPKQIGYIDRSYYLNINKTVTFPTWLMSSCVGGVNTSVLNSLGRNLFKDDTFNYFLNSLGKRAMVKGLFCYSEPTLLKKNNLPEVAIENGDYRVLFKFVKQHYKWVWVWFLALCFILFEKRKVVILRSVFKSIWYKKRSNDFNLEQVYIKSTRELVHDKSIDVIIPTIGREDYLYDVLKDFSKQTLLPKRVIIVEQNPLANSKPSLDYITTEKWPFEIKHIFTHQLGVCNARNIALSKVKSSWVFLGDDDNRFSETLLFNLLTEVERLGTKVGTTVYLQPNEKQTYNQTAQTTIFGAGNSIVKSDLLKQVSFDKRFEFNYGEDTDFGMQLRHLGEDVVFFSNIRITHLKAPIGGYRIKVKQLWEDDEKQPKPSPTIMLLKQRYYTTKQLKGYKLLLFLKFYKVKNIKNPFKYYKVFKEQWMNSLYWYNIIK